MSAASDQSTGAPLVVGRRSLAKRFSNHVGTGAPTRAVRRGFCAGDFRLRPPAPPLALLRRTSEAVRRFAIYFAANAFRAASIVFCTSSSLCAAPRNAASNCEGGR